MTSLIHVEVGAELPAASATLDLEQRRPVAPALLTALASGLLLAAAVVVGSVVPEMWTPRAHIDYREMQYWLNYDEGFIRRGLAGTVLQWFTSGTPTQGQVLAVARMLSLAAALGVLGLCVAAAQRARGRREGLLLVALLLASPLTLTLLVHDVGRLDNVGLLVLAALALPLGWRWQRLPPLVAVAVVGGAVAVATATEEFLLIVVAPAACVRLFRLQRMQQLSEGQRVGLAVVSLLPGAVIAVLSALPGAPRAAAIAQERAQSAGPLPVQDLLPFGRSVVENLEYFTRVPLAVVTVHAVFWSALFLATALVIAKLLPEQAVQTWLQVSIYFGLAGLALSLLGVDFRRWWALALVGLLATFVLTTERRGGSETGGLALVPALAAAALTGFGLAMARFPGIGPI